MTKRYGLLRLNGFICEPGITYANLAGCFRNIISRHLISTKNKFSEYMLNCNVGKALFPELIFEAVISASPASRNAVCHPGY